LEQEQNFSVSDELASILRSIDVRRNVVTRWESKQRNL
jgi:hypothetical protein